MALTRLIFPSLALLPGLGLASIISIPDGGNFATLAEDTRALGFARSLGQTFVVPAPTSENLLTEFTFYVDAGSSPVDIDAAAYLFEFDTGTTSPTGSALYSSTPFSINSAGPLTFNGLSVLLDPGKTYIAFLSTSGLQDEDNVSARIEADQTGNPYAAGQGYRYTGTITDTSSFTGDPGGWGDLGSDWDFRMDATLAVPEPSISVSVLLGGVMLLVRRRRS